MEAAVPKVGRGRGGDAEPEEKEALMEDVYASRFCHKVLCYLCCNCFDNPKGVRQSSY